MDIRKAVDYMGCAYATDDDSIILATYGEWQSMEGGADIRLVIVVPTGKQLITGADLSGSGSPAQKDGLSTWPALTGSNA